MAMSGDLERVPSSPPKLPPSSSATLSASSSSASSSPAPSRSAPLQHLVQTPAHLPGNMEALQMAKRSTEVIKFARMERARQARIYSQTRGIMRVRTEKMFAHASRDYQRHQYAPTQRTESALRRRRYSVDVSTGVEKRKAKKICKLNEKAEQQTLELITPSSSVLPFPKPRRYIELNKFWHCPVPFDDANYFYVDGNPITNKQFLNITCTSGMDSYLEDNALDMTLNTLSIDKNCASNGIQIATSIEAQVCAYRDPAGKEAYARAFGDKKWIFLPVNDAIGEPKDVELMGAHWSLVALDRVHKRMHYYDSAFMADVRFWEAACFVAQGMLTMLDENVQEWEFYREWQTPNQFRDNQFRDAEGNCADDGACGPFVWSMTATLTDHILQAQWAGQEDSCSLGLDTYQDFPARWGSWWHSQHIRKTIQNRIDGRTSGRASAWL
ncbi:hypothetical protein C7974DRAFT_375620 [Boeremia exigua]|uniref:uncharacterized protein n=1 Tax=Boeremia exigua TaxID=749465 RepID=UPI001E8ECB83|nr:uncharacterized protein C7974DRAFT_375620 [Boeremia exigua]KAH6633549.1 hypothetical protein C7974DRAFT_375620 [Boeremia exigua]